MMTAEQDLHDIHTVLFMTAHWADLLPPARNFTAHHLHLLYITVTKGWPSVLYYDQQGEDELLDVALTSGLPFNRHITPG
jgi:hypothetical protein